jgi:hypothetical protein
MSITVPVIVPIFMIVGVPLSMTGPLSLIGPLSLYRERWYWEQQGSRYRANEREFANHLVLHFVFLFPYPDYRLCCN